jgi:hypothetical protein
MNSTFIRRLAKQVNNYDSNNINNKFKENYNLNIEDDNQYLNLKDTENLNEKAIILRQEMQNIVLSTDNKLLIKKFILNENYIQDHLRILLKIKIDSLKNTILQHFNVEWFFNNYCDSISTCNNEELHKIVNNILIFSAVKSFIIDDFDEYLIFNHSYYIFVSNVNYLEDYRENVYTHIENYIKNYIENSEKFK